jgi:hypothetical protein
MANFINIKDFDGVLTNADIEDLPDNVAQEIKNLKIQAGKLEKTFGAGTPSGVPSIGLSFVSSGNYIVYNVYTFISDKFAGDKNDAGDGYRYLLVTIHTSTQAVKLFWWDSGLPDVNDHLQIEDNIVLFTTESPHGIIEDDYILVQDCKDNASPQADITGAGVYDQADHVPNTVTVGVNTDNARQWGGSFFNTAVATGAQALGWGGKLATHLTVDDTVTYDSPAVAQSTIEMIAIASMYGRALCLASVPHDGTQGIVTHDGTSTADLNKSAYNGFRALSNFKVCSMLGFNNAVYVHYSYDKDGTNYNPLVKYQHNGSAVVETVVSANLSTTATTATSFMHICNGVLYVLVQSNGLFSVNTSDSIATVTVTSADIDEFAGLTSITQTNRLKPDGTTSLVDVTHAYLFVATINSPDFDLFYNDVRDASVTAWGRSSSFTGTLLGMTSTDFGQNSDRSESIIIHYTDSGGTRLHYSTHNDTTVYNTFTDVDATTFPTTSDIEFISSTYNSPGNKYLIVGTDNVVSPLANGSLYRVTNGIVTQLLNGPSPGDKASWNPTCFADCVTETHLSKPFFEHAKGYIGVYGTQSQAGVPVGDSADIVRMTDIGWLNNTFNTSGDCDYRWIDIMDRHSIAEVDTSNVSSVPDIFHKKDRNPIIVSGDTIRFIPGAVGKIGIEAKGVWVGHIDRALFNDTVSASADWYTYSNKLNNPFNFTSSKLYNTGKSLRPGNSVKYNITAVYDGVQESLFDKTKELVLVDTSVNNSIVELSIEFDANALNKRITGLNVYRATEFPNTTSFDGYSNYQLVGHMTFVDSQVAIPTTTSSVNARLHVWREDMVFIKSTDNLTGYDGETLGSNKYALDVDGGWDGIDAVTDWAGPPVSSTGAEFQWTVYHSPLARPMTALQQYMVVSALAKDNTLANTYKCEIEDESVVVNSVSTTSEDTGYTATISGTSPFTFTLNTAMYDTAEFAVGDVFRVASAGSGTIASGIDWTITEVTDTTIIKATPPSGTGYAGSVGSVTIKSVASGVLVGIDRHGLGSPSATVTYLDNSTNSTPATHAVNSNLLIRAQSLGRSYSKANLDSNASISDSYLDNGVMVGSDWKIEQRSGWSYSNVKDSTAGGAYGGQRVGFLFFKNPDDITGTLGSDTTGNLLTAGSYAGAIMLLQGDESFEIENNSAYESTLGGCWVKLSEKHDEFGVDSDTIDESDYGHIKDNVRIISGFKKTNAQGATTPGMAFEVTSGTNVRVVCQDYRLEDLGETDVQTVYSNRINAQYAVKLKGRMFLGDLYLNPEDKQEQRADWIAYSELNQYDVRPVSNVVTLDDREGGAVSGLAVLFGRLVIFKPQAIFIMNVPDPSDPNSWTVSESKFSIGNIAPEGVVEVHDSVYFVFHDGIYAVTSNMVADSTATPSIMDKISLPIEDQFNLATSKVNIKGVYNQKDAEVLYTWDAGSPATQIVWAYHIVFKTWRKVDTTTNLDILAYGENSYPLAWDNTDTDLKKFDVDEAVGTTWKSKRFPLDLDRKRLIRYGMVKFTGTDTLTVNIYLDGAGSASFTKTITADGGINRFPIKRYGKNFEIELTTPSSLNAFSVEQMRIETE